MCNLLVWTEPTANSIEALASIATFVVALLVFWEARSFRRSEGIFRQNTAWNDFGNAVAELHEGSRIGDLLMGKAVAGNLNPREAFLLMSFFNVVSSEYNAFRAKAIDREYVIHSLTMTSRVVRSNRDWIFSFLRDYGYEESFRRVVAIVALTSDEVETRRKILRRELFALSFWGKMCGTRFRAWLRKHLNESEVKALCEGTLKRLAA